MSSKMNIAVIYCII